MKISFVAALILATNFVFAQDKKVSLEDKGFIDNRFFVGPTGMFLTFEKDKKTNVARYYDKDLELLWEKEYTQKQYGNGGMLSSRTMSSETSYDIDQNYTVSTPTGSLIYVVDYKNDDYHQKPHYVTQFTKSGEMKSFKIDPSDDLGYSFQTAFCDEEYFYMLATDNGWEQREKKKESEKLIFNRFDSKTFQYKRVVLDLPVVESGDHTAFWTFVGQNATEKFLVSKNINYEAEAPVITVAAFDKEGKVTRTWKMETKLNNLAFLRPAVNIRASGTLYHQVANFDYFIVQSKSGATGITYNEPRNDYSAFTSVAYDELNDAFYVFGLFGPKPFKKIGANYDGFYIYKYDSKGTSIWKLQQKAPPTLANYGPFKVHSTPAGRFISLRFGGDNSLNFSVQSRKLLATFVINAEGKVVRSVFDNNFIEQSPSTYVAASPSKAEAYLKKANAKKKNQQVTENAVLPDREIVFQANPGEILLFKK